MTLGHHVQEIVFGKAGQAEDFFGLHAQLQHLGFSGCYGDAARKGATCGPESSFQAIK